MGEIFAYSLCSSILLLLLYTVYKWVLSGEKQHTYNRIILWLIYAVALLAAPAIGRWHQLLSASDLAAVAIGDAGFTPDVIASADKASQALWLTVVLWVYVVGCVVIMLHTLWIGWRLRSLISSAREVARVGSKIVLVTDDSGVAPFSWYRYIVMNRSDWAESSQMILLHESQHIALCHSLDLLVGQLVAIFQWYNPAAWLMREEMKAVHEYQADEAVIASGVSVRDYQMLLIKKAVGARFPSLANSLNHSKLKKRITMMYNPKNQQSAACAVWLSCPHSAWHWQ